MSMLYPALGASIALAGGDKLAGERSYRRMFEGLGWSRADMRAVAAVEVIGGLLMAPRLTRRLGGVMVVAASISILNSELRHGDTQLAGPRALVLLAGLCATLAPGRSER